MILSWPAGVCASIQETGFGSPSSEYSTNFLYTQRPPRLRRHTIPQTSRPAIDRLGMITRQRCQASDHPCRRSERTAESVSLLLVISDPRYPKDDELGAAATGTAGSEKKPLPAIELLSRLRAAQRRNGMRRRSEGASARCPSCRCGQLQARRQRHRVS
jgi:hypothetical protein